MIDLIIKTLDSNNHHFSVEDETTVEQLKDKIRERLGLEAHLQRLIFYGRVLQDDKKLMDIDVNGKVLHLVQRPPPSSRSREQRPQTSSTTTSNITVERTAAEMRQQIRRLMALTGPPDYLLEHQQQLTLSPTAGRLESIRRMIAEIKTSLIRLAAHVNHEEYSGASDSGEVPVEQMDNELGPDPTQDEAEPNIDDNGDIIPEFESRAQNSRRRSYRAMRAMRVRLTRPRDFAQLLDDLIGLQEQFAPHRDNYIRMLRAANFVEVPQFTEEQRQHEQRFVELVSDIMHSFGHAYHAVCDIHFQVGMRNPRLVSESVTPRHPVPMQAHINVVQSNRRPPQEQANNVNASTNNASSAPATVTSANATVTTNMETGDGGTQGNQITAQTGGGTTTTTSVNVNAQLDPLTYQVEIETRVPIAVPVENVVLHEMANLAAATSPQQQQSEQNQGQQQNTNPQGQGNRRQWPTNFNTVIRELSQAGWLGDTGTGAVEVLMSMEEIPESDVGSNAIQERISESGVYMASIPWTSAPGAELLQNIVTTMIRHGFMPGVEGVAVPVTGQAQDQARTQTQHQAQPQATNAQGNREQQATQNQPRQPSLHLRRATTTRSHAVPLSNWLYDRYLQCDSPHARRHVQRRRMQYQQQVAAHERLRSMRTAAQNIETLRERIPNITHDHMTTLIGLLNNTTQTPAAWLVAFMVAVARHLFLADAMCSVGSEPPLVPHEFSTLRVLLRNYIQDLITRSECTDGENAFQGVADFVVDEHAEFINNMRNITLVVPGIDVLESIRALVRSRLPAVIATVMSDSPGEVAATRFYGVFSRVFMDLSTLIALVCPECGDGLKAVYTFFMEQMVQDFDEATRQLLITLSTENLNGVVNDLRAHMDSVRQFVRYNDEFFDNMPMFPEQLEPMEVSPSPLVTDEPMQTTPPATPCPVHGPNNAVVRSVLETVNDDDNTDSSASTSSLKSVKAASVQEPPPAEPSISNQSPKLTNNNDTSDTTTTERSATDATPNIQIVSPLMIMQHWSEEWVPVISRDQQAQSADPPEPYSDAYLSGMPAKKRRCIRQARPPTTLNGFMNESAREAVSRTTSLEDNSALRSAFREHMRNMARNRSAVSEDYDPLRYASAARFLGPRMNKRQASESNSEKNDK